MSETQKLKMTVDEFLIWALDQPGRHELVGGRVYAMSPERIAHGRTKQAALRALDQAIKAKELACEALPDGMTVRIDHATVYEPDALVYCGPRLPGEAIEVPNPLIVVEVLSPSTGSYDKGGKLVGYFMVPSIQHYLIVDPDRRVIVHHRRDGDAIATRIVGFGAITLNPPGFEVEVEALLGPE